MDIILKNVKKKDFPVLKSLAKSLGFEIAIEEEKPYNPEFVKEILEAAKEVREGKGIRMTMEELKELCK
jgi:3-polyprenyl-4-hydroxybenzoate decarboxylase